MTDLEIQEQAEKCLQASPYLVSARSFIRGFKSCAKWMQDQDKWISVDPMSAQTAEILANTDLELIQCLFDNGEVFSMNDHHPIGLLMTHIFILPTPPKTK